MYHILKLTLLFLALSLFGYSTNMKNSIYLIGSEVLLNGDEQSLRFIATQTVEKKVALENVDGLELVFQGNKLVEKYQLMYGDRDELELADEEVGFQIPFQPTPNPIFLIETSESKTNSYLGGETPQEFVLPKFDSKPSFQFLGLVSNKTEGLDWLPFDIFLTAPLFGHFDPLFLDYSDPLSPNVINEEHYLTSGYEDEFVAHDTELAYQKTFIKTYPSDEIPEFEDNIGVIGVPTWIQYPAIPVCPISGRTMKFVFQLNFGLDIPLRSSNITIEERASYLKKMNFYGDGDLFLFVETQSKVVCVIIQHT